MREEFKTKPHILCDSLCHLGHCSVKKGNFDFGVHIFICNFYRTYDRGGCLHKKRKG